MPLAAFPKCFLDALSVDRTMTVEDWIVQAADRLDIDGLDFYWGFTPHEDEAALARLRRLAESRELAIPMMCYSPDFIQPDPQERRREIEAQKRAIEVTALLGGKFCRVLSGQRREGVGRAEGIGMASESIQACLPHAQAHGITLVLENHFKDGYWQFPEFAQKQDVFLELLASIPASPWFGVNFDPSNAIIAGDDPLALLEAVKHRVVSMHASDRFFAGGVLTHGVIGQGINDYNKIFSLLASVGFAGWVSIEDGQDPAVGMEHLQLSAQFLRAKMTEHGLK